MKKIILAHQIPLMVAMVLIMDEYLNVGAGFLGNYAAHVSIYLSLVAAIFVVSYLVGA